MVIGESMATQSRLRLVLVASVAGLLLLAGSVTILTLAFPSEPVETRFERLIDL